jgi:phosphoglycerate dehydrogenase-like enzyme
MTKLRIFVDFSASGDVLELLRTGTAGHHLVFPREPVRSVLSMAAVDPGFSEVDVAFGQPDPHSVEQGDHLKWIHISSSGFTRYDTPRFRELVRRRGIVVSNSADVYSEACAVHALAFMLAQARRLPQGLGTQTDNGTEVWNKLRNSSRTLKGEEVLILGYGAIGRRVVELLRPFDIRVVAYRRKARGDETIPVITEDQLPGALARADHVLNILPESDETRHFFHRKRFASLKPGAVFYNIGRGATVDQDSLLEVLNSGRLEAAWLDVTDPEPLPEIHPLRGAPNCYITPHIAGGHTGEPKTLVQHFLKNLDRYVRGEPLLNRIM